jgi:hypothetical protein
MVSKPWALLTAIAVLFAGLSNAHAHVHYCFDGQEPPAAVHFTDGTDHSHERRGDGHHEDHAAHDTHDEHDDLDLDLPNQALAKAAKHDMPALAPTLCWAAVIARMPGTALTRQTDVPPAPHPRYTHPPLRGPPA